MLALSVIIPAHAQAPDEPSYNELKALVLKLEKRVDQLEAAQKHAPSTQQRAAPVAAGAASAQVQAAQQAAAKAQQAADQAQKAAAQAEQEALQAKDNAAAEVKAAFAPPPGKPGGSFKIPGTETVVRLYGFAKLNIIGDLTSQDQSDAITGQSLPLFGTAAQRQGGTTQISARRSRFDAETWTPIDDAFGEFHTLMEMDFAGQNTSLTTQSTANGFTPRLRKFYADFGKPNGGLGAFLFGQESSLYSDSPLLPIQLLNDATYVGVSNIRQGQVRYTYGFGNGVSAAFAVESPYSDITTSSGTSYPDSNGGSGVGWQETPDFTGRVLWKQDWGLLAVRGVVRPQIDLNNNGASNPASRFSESTTGYGVGVTGVLNVLPKQLVLMATGNYGDGLGRYLDATSNGFGAVSNAGLPGVTATTVNIDAVQVYGGMVGLQYFFTPTIRTNMALGGGRLILPSYAAGFGGCVGAASSSGTCSSTNTGLWQGSINLIWSPFRAVDIGLEYIHAERALNAAFSTGTNTATTGGIQNTIQASLIGRF